MDLKSLLDLGTETLTVFRDHIIILLALLVIAYLVGRWSQRSTDDGELRGLRAQKQAADDRLQLAHDQNETVVTQVRELEAKVAVQSKVTAESQASIAMLQQELANVPSKLAEEWSRYNEALMHADLPLNFHPAAIRASAVDTPFGAV